MKTLVTNDDGVYCPGLWAVVTEMKKMGDVVVVAPDREQSGVGTAVTFHQPLRFKEVSPLVSGVPAYSVEGTPADSVILALRYLFPDQVDLVISGINEGANLGSDAYISGTVGAALQGFLCGLSSLAVSVGSWKEPLFLPAALLTRLLAEHMLATGGSDIALPQPVLLNVNLPNLPLEQTKGVEITRLSFKKSTDAVHEGYDGKRRYYWIVHQKPSLEAEPGTDRWALKQDFVSITPFLSHVSIGSVASVLQQLAPTLCKQFLPHQPSSAASAHLPH
ncbi:MAG: 5'/3'-nucleotidase SurE [Chloroflexi bacterium]|nr:5'/3'-nucleotidase SurE [Chloroflexota bacterium]